MVSWPPPPTAYELRSCLVPGKRNEMPGMTYREPTVRHWRIVLEELHNETHRDGYGRKPNLEQIVDELYIAITDRPS